MPPTEPRPSRSRKPKQRETDTNVIAAVRELFSNASGMKLVVAVLVILVALWNFFGFDDRLAANETRLDVIEQVLDTRFDKLSRRADDLEASRQDFNAGIARAVARGIEKGNKELLRRLESLVKRVEALEQSQ